MNSNLSGDWVLDDARVAELLRGWGFAAPLVEFAARAAREIAAAGETAGFFEMCRLWPSDPSRFSGDDYSCAWKLLAVVSAFPATFEKHAARGVPAAITRATLRDLQRHVEYSDGAVHFRNLNWLRNHVGGEFFEIGRLQYHLGTFAHRVRVYRDSESGEIETLALDGRRCTLDGWPADDAQGFVTRFEEREDGIYGHPVSRCDGSISQSPKRIPRDSTMLLGEKFPIAHIHIPSGEKLTREACVASLRAAALFFETHFPEVRLRGYVTATWLLDPELSRVLSPRSNIVAFARLFRPMPLQNGNDRQLLERAFGRDASWENCRAETSLQKSVLERHRTGGRFRSGAGFILPEDLETFSHTQGKL